MAKAPPFLLLLAFLSLSALLPSLSARPVTSGDVLVGGGRSFRELLSSKGLPGGLFPRGVEYFSLDLSSGLLEVRLRGPCYARYDDNLTYFERVVRGKLSYGELTNVVGWSEKELFLWLPVKGIVVSDPSSGVVLVDIALAHKELAASVFEEPPECRPDAGIAEGQGADRNRILMGFP
ncbi:uncharacterized protein LOC141813870 [Curcuma longa]|uniref:uncharacterized protein LOC141813870 n=1 Tax=Curcuma longa TaxID=136217 RepID=UPI003D9E5190